jgi:hypothetical protein
MYGLENVMAQDILPLTYTNAPSILPLVIVHFEIQKFQFDSICCFKLQKLRSTTINF